MLPTPTATPTAEERILNTLAPVPRAMVYADWAWDANQSFDETAVTINIHNDITYGGDHGLYHSARHVVVNASRRC